MILSPQITESNAVSENPLETVSLEDTEDIDVASSESLQWNVHSTIQMTPPTRTSHPGDLLPSAISNDPVSAHPLETSSPKEVEDVEITSGEPSHPDILATIEDTPPLPGPSSSDSLHSMTSDAVISASRRSPSSASLDTALQRPQSGGSLHSRHCTHSDVGDTASAEPPNTPELPTNII